MSDKAQIRKDAHWHLTSLDGSHLRLGQLRDLVARCEGVTGAALVIPTLSGIEIRFTEDPA